MSTSDEMARDDESVGRTGAGTTTSPSAARRSDEDEAAPAELTDVSRAFIRNCVLRSWKYRHHEDQMLDAINDAWPIERFEDDGEFKDDVKSWSKIVEWKQQAFRESRAWIRELRPDAPTTKTGGGAEKPEGKKGGAEDDITEGQTGEQADGRIVSSTHMSFVQDTDFFLAVDAAGKKLRYGIQIKGSKNLKKLVRMMVKMHKLNQAPMCFENLTPVFRYFYQMSIPLQVAPSGTSQEYIMEQAKYLADALQPFLAYRYARDDRRGYLPGGEKGKPEDIEPPEVARLLCDHLWTAFPKSRDILKCNVLYGCSSPDMVVKNNGILYVTARYVFPELYVDARLAHSVSQKFTDVVLRAENSLADFRDLLQKKGTDTTRGPGDMLVLGQIAPLKVYLTTESEKRPEGETLWNERVRMALCTAPIGQNANTGEILRNIGIVNFGSIVREKVRWVYSDLRDDIKLEAEIEETTVRVDDYDTVKVAEPSPQFREKARTNMRERPKTYKGSPGSLGSRKT